MSVTVVESAPRPPRLAALLRSPEATLAGLFILLLVIGVIVRPHLYLTQANITTVLEASIVPLVVALGASIGLLGGVVDLSVGSVVGLTATVFAIVYDHGASPWLAALAAVAVGLAVGLVNATVTVVFGAEPIVATLGSLVGAAGLTLVLDHNLSEAAFVTGWQNAVGSQWGPFPIVFVVIAVAFLLSALAVRWTRPGRHLQATGGNVRSAERAGIRTARIRTSLFLITAGAAATGGLIYIGQLGAAPTNLGTGLELQVYTAIVLGGFSLLQGGVGNPLGALLGVLSIAMLTNLLDISGVYFFWEDVIIGILLIVAVFLDNLRRGEGFDL